jgi:hypothetical protein
MISPGTRIWVSGDPQSRDSPIDPVYYVSELQNIDEYTSTPYTDIRSGFGLFMPSLGLKSRLKPYEVAPAGYITAKPSRAILHG